MLISGIGFSALQRATHNPYEHLFTTGSSLKQYTTPSAWGPAFAPAPSPFLQPMLKASGGSASIESANESTPEPAPTSESASFRPGSSQTNRASSPGLAHSYGAPGSAPFTPAAGTAGGASASIESASPEDNGAAPPGIGQAELSPYHNSNKAGPASDAAGSVGPWGAALAYSPSGQHPEGTAPLSTAAFGPAGITATALNGLGPGAAPVLSGTGRGDRAGASTPLGSAAVEGMASQAGAPPPEAAEALDAGSSPQGSATLATPDTQTRAPGLQPSFGPSQASYQSALSPASTAAAAAARGGSSQGTQGQASAAGSAASGAAAPPGRRKRRIMAEPVDVEDATSMPALSTAAMAATATTAVAPSLLPLKEDTLHDPILTSGPGLSDAIVTANATPAQMVAVPLSEQHPTATVTILPSSWLIRGEPLQLPGFGMQRRALEAEARFYQLQDLEQQLSCGVQSNRDTKADLLQRDIAKFTFEEGSVVLFESAKAKIGAAKGSHYTSDNCSKHQPVRL
ncbi:hypothetical protein WJX82_000357 [Trebouxia sp. C0006]